MMTGRAILVVFAAGACREGFEPRARPIDASIADADAVVDAVIDARPDAAVTVVAFRVDCSTGVRTVGQICSAAGFSQVVVAHAYHWFQCAGPSECPTGWAADGVSCADWCIASDCSSVPYCGAGQVITERVGGASLTMDPAEFQNCVGYNAGWVVRAQCSN